MPSQITNIIASRDMIWTRDSGEEAPIVVTIGDLVYQESTDPELCGQWAASIQIAGHSISNSIHTVYGMDSVQALYHALALAGSILQSSAIANQIDFAALPNFGFPTLLPMPINPELDPA